MDSELERVASASIWGINSTGICQEAWDYLELEDLTVEERDKYFLPMIKECQKVIRGEYQREVRSLSRILSKYKAIRESLKKEI